MTCASYWERAKTLRIGKPACAICVRLPEYLLTSARSEWARILRSEKR